MSSKNPLDIVQPGDILLYADTDWKAWIIRLKTGSPVSHCEMAWYNGFSLASRPGEGVNTYELRTRTLVRVLRPRKSLDELAVEQLHGQCRGQFYDWFGLLRFFTFGKESLDKQFCSEYLVRLMRAGGVDPFAAAFPADLVYPGLFDASSELSVVWSA